MAKKKSKLKKLLKGVALAGAAALGANALRNRRAKPLGVSGADKALFTSDAAQMDNTMPANLSSNMGMRGRDSILAKPGINRITDYYGSGLKKGGTVVKTGEKAVKRKKKIGIQIKGFGKARRG